MLTTTVWFGLFAGLLELGLLLATKPLRDSSPGLFRMNRHVVWMIPTFDLAFFAALGLLILPVSWARPRLGQRVGMYASIFLTLLIALFSFRRLHFAAILVLAIGATYRIARMPSLHGLGFRRWTLRTLPVLGLVGGALVALTIGRSTLADRTATSGLPPAKEGAKNVLLVVMDTVRADALSVYGYGRPTTPNLERLAKRGVKFERAWSTAPWTLPSHCSIMTGRWPHEMSAELYSPLDATYPTLAEHLAGKGYATGGFVANTTYCGSETGLARGFSHYEDNPISVAGMIHNTALGSRVIEPAVAAVNRKASRALRGNGKKTARSISDHALAWIDARGDRPFFAFLNFFDAHNPYVTPKGFNRHLGIAPANDADYQLLGRWFYVDPKTLTPRELQLGRDAYDDCIAYIDEQLGRLFDELDRRGVLDETLVIVTSDHGEAFGEHGLFGHASSLYHSELRVPLLIVEPKRVPGGRTVAESVSLRDLPATVVDLLGVSDGSAFPGRSLARAWSSSGEATADPLLSEVVAPVMSPPNHGRSPVFRGSMDAVVDEEKIYIRNKDGTEELFDLATDPEQLHDLSRSPESSAVMDRLRRSIDRIRSAPGNGDRVNAAP